MAVRSAVRNTIDAVACVANQLRVVEYQKQRPLFTIGETNSR